MHVINAEIQDSNAREAASDYARNGRLRPHLRSAAGYQKNFMCSPPLPSTQSFASLSYIAIYTRSHVSREKLAHRLEVEPCTVRGSISRECLSRVYTARAGAIACGPVLSCRPDSLPSRRPQRSFSACLEPPGSIYPCRVMPGSRPSPPIGFSHPDARRPGPMPCCCLVLARPSRKSHTRRTITR